MSPILTRMIGTGSAGSGFGFGRRRGGAAAGLSLVADAYGSNLVLAMPFNVDYTDYAYVYNSGATPSTRTWTSTIGSGGIVQFQSSTYKFYNNAHRIYNGTGGAFASTTDFTYTNFYFTGDFTIEAWLYIDNGASDVSFIGASTGASLPNPSTQSSAGVRGVGSGLTGAMQLSVDNPYRGGSWTYGVWAHYAAGRTGSTLYYFKDGVSTGTASFGTGTIGNTGAATLVLGGTNTYVPNMNIYLNDLRVYKGVNKYTTGFTPPTQMLF
jgi:hypothetical protein